MHIIIGLFLIIMGLLNILNPVKMINLRLWMTKKGQEPAPLSILTARIGGFLIIVLGTLIMFEVL